MPKARKDHKCCLCRGSIVKGEQYAYREITPWDHPNNETFWTYKAHSKCDHVWGIVGEDFDWEIPDYYDWKEQLRIFEKEE